MTFYIWECNCCGTRYVEEFNRVSKPCIGMEIMIPWPHKCKARPGITNESVMILKEIKKGGMKRVVNICSNVFGQVKCNRCNIPSDIGWYKTDGTDIFCPICGYKIGTFEQKKKK